MPLQVRKRILFLILVMAIVGFVVSTVAITMLYKTAFEVQRERLVETAHSRARLIEAVARFDAIYSQDYPKGPEAATLRQIIDAHKNFKGFGETGEFTLARLVDAQMVFILSHRHHDLDKPESVPFDSTLAEPMRQALSGNSGSLVGLDYRGVMVIAAYEPVGVLDLGIVVKIDISEIRAPFVWASFTAAGVAIAVIILASFIFLRISDPMVRRLQEYSDQLEEQVVERTSLLMRSEKKYRSLFENMLDGFAYCKMIFDSDDKPVDFVYLEINDAFTSLTGLTKEMVIDKKVTEAIPGIRETNPELFEIYGSVAFTGKEKEFETYVEPLDIWFSISVYSPQKGYFVAVFDNITERKRAESEMRKLQTAIEHSANMIVITDIDGVIEYVNPRFTEITGYSKEEALGANPRILASKETPKEVHKELWDTILSGESWRGVYKNQKKDGEEYLASTVITPVKDEQGAITHFLAVQEDVTERQKLELELANAQRLDSLGVLAGGIAHDFNNILTGILANISLANDLSKEEKVKSRLKEAEKASFMAKSLTQQLLTFSKGGEPIKKAFDPGKLVRDSTEFALRGSKTACEFEISKNLSVVEADDGQIDQVIQNLVINADQAMPEGGIIKVKVDDVVVGAKQDIPLRAGKYVRISVKDQGIGIPDNIISKIFDPFYTTKSAGSGLGLASAYSIVRKHNGHIAVTSKSGEGSTFDIYLPVSELSVPLRKTTKDGIVRGTGRVLVMDDELILREVVGEILGNLGYDVEVVEDGSEAIEAYSAAKEKGNPFDLVIMDLTIPGGMGGEEAIGKLIK
ncbi:MAG: PAS domain S-box protein, partial [Thermodesulfobacteriota bacterium]